MNFTLRIAIVAVLWTALPGPIDAQRVMPSFAPDQAATMVSPFRKAAHTDRRNRLAVDSTSARDKTPYVVGGAVLGAIAGAFLYRREVDKLNDADFAAGYSIPIFVGGGAVLGALLGYFVGSFGDPPVERKSGYRRFARRAAPGPAYQYARPVSPVPN